MSIKVRPLLAPYAKAAGEMIQARLAAFGPLPDALEDEHHAWTEANSALGTVTTDGPEARRLDPFVDRVVLLPAYICQEILRAYADLPVTLTAPQSERVEDARTLLAAFGDDLRSLVNVPFIEEWSAVRDLLRRLRDEKSLATAVKRLGLTEDIDLCERLHKVYGQALGLSADTPREAPEARLATWNTTFRDLLVGASFLERKHPGLYAVFAEPHAEQLRKQQEVTARQRAPHSARHAGGPVSGDTKSPPV